MPTRTKNVEMKYIVTDLEIHLHNCFCESRGFKVGRSSHRRSSIKKMFLKISQNWQENTCDAVSSFITLQASQVFSCQFCKTLRTPFLQNTSGDCFWTGLMVKKFNYVSLIFLSLDFLYHAPPERSLLCWCNEEHLLMKKMLGFNSGTAIICEWNQHEHVWHN